MSIEDISLSVDFSTLQQQLSVEDARAALMEPRRPSSRDNMELFLFKVKQMKFKMYQEKTHSLPHIHIDYGKDNHSASYAIATGERLEGNLPKKYDTIILDWVIRNQNKLLLIWDALQKGNSDEYEKLIKELPGS